MFAECVRRLTKRGAQAGDRLGDASIALIANSARVLCARCNDPALATGAVAKSAGAQRRVGNSNVVSIPREFEASGYTPGASVLVEELADGELRILPTDRVRERVRQIADRVVREHPEAIEILANHDPDR
jgi:antitoxin component of MazEF toxin-antitoxin module